MLSKIRKNLRAFSIPLWIVAASFVGTIFLVWGRGSISGPSGNEVATVNGEGIDLVEFNREYSSLVRELKQQFGENFRKLFPEKEIKLTALQRLITRKLLLQAAKEEGIKVSDWAVAKEIMSYPLFQKDGKFSVELYEEFLKANRLTKHTFEEMVREDLTIQKLLEVIDYSPSVTDFEVKELYKETFGKRDFSFRLFPAESFKPKVTEKEIEEYYRSHKKEFTEKTGKQYFLIKIPKGEKNAQDKAKEAFRLAKSGKTEELRKFSPEPVTDKKLIEKRFKGKNFGFYSDKNNFYVFFKQEGKKVKPLKTVKEEIVKKLKMQKALQLAEEAATKFLRENKGLTKKIKGLDKASFFEKFKPLNPADVDRLFSLHSGAKMVVALSNGYGVFQPTSEIRVDKYEKEKIEQIKKFILNIKRQSNYANFVSLLRKRATIKINHALFKR